MDPAEQPTSAPAREFVFRDGLGERRHREEAAGAGAELLGLRHELAVVPSFEFALRERASRLTGFRHPSFARVRTIERAAPPHTQLIVVSDATPGIRLSALIAGVESRGLAFETNAVLYLLRQLVIAIAALHETARDTAHGAIAPERLVVTPSGRLVVVEYVLGSALEQLLLSRDRYWSDLRVALPRMAGLPRFDHLTDVTQIGSVALSLFLGRPLRDEEYPTKIAEVAASARMVSARGAEPLPAALRAWLERALQLDPRQSFPSAIEARAGLEKAIADSGCEASQASLEQFLARYNGVDRPQAMAPAAPAVVPSVASAPTPRPMPIADAVMPRPIPIASAPTPAPLPIAAVLEPDRPAPGVPFDKPATTGSVMFAAADEPTIAARASRRSRSWVAAAVIGLAVLVGGATIGARKFFPAPAPTPTTGTLTIATDPPGARVSVDGAAKGATPLTLTLAPGSHRVELHSGGGSRSLPVTIAAGTQASQFIEMPKPASNIGQLRIRTEPAGARVTIDGAPRGVAPTLVANLTPGEHTVVAETDHGSATQSVMVEAGTTASVLLTMTSTEAPAAASGWITVSGKVPVQIFEKGELVGTSESSKVMVVAGRHEFELINDALGYKSARAVNVTSGKVSTLIVDPPPGSIALNALPWAEVWIDGAKVGDTPIGNFSLPIGSHEVVFKHPELGEQTFTAIVTLKEATRLSADLRKK